MADVDQNNRQAQKWPELETKRLESAQASAKVDSKQRGLFDALSEVVKSGLKDLYGDVNDPKYLYIVNMVMARVRAAISEKLVDFGTDEIQNLTKLLDAKLAAQTKEQYESLSQTFTDVVQTAFSDLTVKVDADDKIELLDSVREYVENAVRTIKENQSSDEIISKLDEVKDKLLKSFGQDKVSSDSGKTASDLKASFRTKTQTLIQQQLTVLASNQKRLQTNMSVNFKKTDVLIDRNVGKLDTVTETLRKSSEQGKSGIEKPKADLKANFRTKAQSLIQQQLTILASNQKRLQTNMSVSFKKTGSLVDKNVGKLDTTINSSMNSLGGKLSAISKSIKSLSFGNIMSSIGGGLMNILSGPLGWITGSLSKLWGGVCGLTKWAAGGLFSILGKFFKTPAGLFAIGYMIGYAYTKWIKPWWDNIAKTEIGKWLNGEQGFLDMMSNTIKKTLGLDPNKGMIEQLVEKITSIEICKFDSSIMSTITNAINKAGEIVGVKPPATSGSFTIGTAFTAIGGLIAANIASSILGSPVFMVATGVGAAILAIKSGIDWVMKKLGFEGETTVSTAAAVTGNAMNIAAQPVRQANAIVKAETKVAKATEKVVKTAQKLDKADDAIKAAQAAGDAGKIAKAEKQGEKALKAAIKAEESLDKSLVKLGIKSDKASGFAKWLSKFPKIAKALKFLGPVGILTTAASSIWELYSAYEAYEAGKDELANIKVGKAAVGLLSLAGGPAGMAVGFGAEMVLDKAAEWQEAMYEATEAAQGASDMDNKLWHMYLDKSKKLSKDMSQDQLLKIRLAKFEKVKAEVERHKARQKELEDAVLNASVWRKMWDSSGIQADAVNAQAEGTAIQKALAEMGFASESQLREFEKQRAELVKKVPKLDVEMTAAQQKLLEDFRIQAGRTKDKRDDEFVKTITDGFNSGNAEVIEMLKTIIANQGKTKPSLAVVMGGGQPGFNPALMDSQRAASVQADLNR